jgi:hypothetical protein
VKVRGIGVALVVGALALTAVPRATEAAPRAPEAPTASTCAWTQQTADVTPAMASGVLNAVTVVSATDAWAIGQYNTGSATGSFWENWNGSAWSVVGNGAVGADLVAVTSFGVNDVVAVGGDSTGPLIAAWNGTSITRATIPSAGTNAALTYISGTSSTNIWAAGTTGSGVLLYHYNGSAWTMVTAPTGVRAEGILALTTKDAWMPVETSGKPNATLYDWNGSRWSVSSILKQPKSNRPKRYITGPIVGTSDTNLSLIANETGDHAGNWESVPYVWNGSTWTRFTDTDTNMYTDADNGFLNAAMAEGATAGEVWRAGFDGSFKGDYADGPLVQLDNVDSLYVGDGNTDVAGAFVGVAAGAGLVIAVGGNIEWPYNLGEPIVYIGTGCP